MKIEFVQYAQKSVERKCSHLLSKKAYVENYYLFR